MKDPVGWRPLLRLLSGIVLRLWCGSCFLASAAPAERYFATMETRQQLLGMWLYSGESFMAPFSPTLSGGSSDRVGVMGGERLLAPGVACCCNTH